MNASDVILKHRKSRGLSQAAFGKLVGLHQTRIAVIESGKRNVGVVVAIRIAERLGLPERDRKFVRDAYKRAGIPYTPAAKAGTP